MTFKKFINFIKYLQIVGKTRKIVPYTEYENDKDGEKLWN
jgi:hypothetical protein